MLSPQERRHLHTGRSPCTSSILPIPWTTVSSMTISLYGWGRQLSPTSRNFMESYSETTTPSRRGFQQAITASIYPTVSFHRIRGVLTPKCTFPPYFVIQFKHAYRLQADRFPLSFSLIRYFWPWPPALSDFPVQYFRGRKEVVLTTVTWFGGQNHFLPIAYLVTSSLILLTAVVLTVVWWKFGKDGKNMKEWRGRGAWGNRGMLGKNLQAD